MTYMLGRTPEDGGVAGAEVTSRDEKALGGLATMSQLGITLSGPRGGKTAALLLYVANGASAAAPTAVLVGLNFMGNHSTTTDPRIEVSPGYVSSAGWETNAAERAAQERRWPVRVPLERGYVASATQDAHADPRGEFLSTLYASPIFELYGYHGTLPAALAKPGEDLPWQDAVGIPTPGQGGRVGERLSYHMREGIHDVLAEDWTRFVDFAEANLAPLRR